MWGNNMCLGVSHAPTLRGEASVSPKFLGLPIRCMRNNIHILRGDQTRCDENFTGSTQMLTRDLLVVAVQDLHKICKYYILLVL